MKPRGVQLHYQFLDSDPDPGLDRPAPAAQRSAELQHALFALLQALHRQGSIHHAAKALGASYRHVWGRLRHWEAVLGQPLVAGAQGQPARLTPFAERLLWTEARARARLAPQIDRLRAELAQALDDALEGPRPTLQLIADDDLALPLLRDWAAEAQHLRIRLRSAHATEALRALDDTEPVDEPRVIGLAWPTDPRLAARQAPVLHPDRHVLIAGLRRRQGLMFTSGHPLGTQRLTGLEAGSDNGPRFVLPAAGSGARLLLRQVLAQHGLHERGLNAVATEDGAQAVAAAVASGAADAGFGLEAAARAQGLAFLPLADEDLHLACLAEHLQQPAIQALRQALASPGWAAHLQAHQVDLPGYAPAHQASMVLALNRTPPPPAPP